MNKQDLDKQDRELSQPLYIKLCELQINIAKRNEEYKDDTFINSLISYHNKNNKLTPKQLTALLEKNYAGTRI